MNQEILKKFIEMASIMQASAVGTKVKLFGIESQVDTYKKGMKILKIASADVRQQDITSGGTTLLNSDVFLKGKRIGVVNNGKFIPIFQKPDEPAEVKTEPTEPEEPAKPKRAKAPKVEVEKATA